ncbi:MAG: transport-associated protein [Candidatus Acidoferrum typicum]|nr:transport-associated protein [Candidatus Acidoferrum typicum]
MKLMRIVLLTMLIQPILGPGPLGAQQGMNNQKGARNSDEWIKKEVRHELLTLPWYSVFDNLAYSVNGNEVTLLGQVVQPTLKSDAENAVKHIEGVEKVNNQIEVLPTSPMDDQIRRAEYRAIYSQDLLSRYGVGNLQSIHIIVKNGHVTLEGFVDSQQDKDAATLYAKSVPNVFSVDNHLIVNGQSNHRG